jgi:hypothetical protein
VTTTKNAVRVFIGGEEYTVRSEVPPEYTREVAAYLDAALKRVRDSLPMVESHRRLFSRDWPSPTSCFRPAGVIRRWQPESPPWPMSWPDCSLPPNAVIAQLPEECR